LPQQSPSFVRSAALLAIAALVPVLVFAGFSAVSAYAQRQDELRSQAVADARRLSEAVDRELIASLDAAQAMAALPVFDTAMDLEAFDEVARRELARHPLWLTVLVLDPEGRRLTNSRTPERLGPAVDPSSLTRAVRGKRPLVGALTKGPVEYGIPLRAPVVRDGRVRAVVTVVIRPRGVSDTLRAGELPQTWIASVIDGDGRLAGRTHSAETYVGHAASKGALDARARADRGVYSGRTLEGVATISAFWQSPVTGWSVHIGMPKAAFEAPLRRSIVITAIGSLFSLLLAAAFVALLVRELRLRRRETAALEQSNRLEALGRLTGGVAHDFNNLLMIIQGNAEILQRRVQGDAAHRPLAAIREATTRAAKLTRELLVFARGAPAERVRLDLNATIEDFLESIGQAVGPGVAVATELSPAAGVVEIDRVQFELALLNLAVNARDAMDGAGELRILTRRPDPDTVEILVCDSGPGIPPEIAGRVFDPFFTTKPAGVGTGLGLTQVYSFAKQAGGSVRVVAGERRGAAMALRLPAAQGPAEALETAEAETAPDGLAGRRFLLLDDNAEVRAVSAQHLRELGAEVVEGDSAAAGLAALRGGAFDALVSDIVMPGELDGLGLAERVRADDPALPILLVSGYSESSAAAVARGFRVMRKPYALAELGRVLAALLRAGEDRSGAA
jgi:signal transduction histidine kinase/CheY-like chemotaxis protein